MNKRGIFIGALFAFLVLCCTAFASGIEFTADLIETEGDKIQSGKLYVKGALYRIDKTVNDEIFSILVNQDSCITRVMRISKKQYVQVGCQDPASLMGDPFQGLKYSVSNYDSEYDGKDSVNGFLCDRYVVSNQDQKILTYWKSLRLDFPLKVEIHIAHNTRLETRQVREEPLSDDLFQLPSDYTKMFRPGSEPETAPDWADQISSASVMAPPFEQVLTAGGILRIKTVPGKSIWIKSSGLSGDEAVARAIPFKDGMPLDETSKYNNFAQRGTICTRQHETTEEADEIIVRVSQGTVHLTAKYADMHEKKVVTGEQFRVPLSGRENIEMRVVNLIDGESTFKWDYLDNGQILPEETVGPARFRTKILTDKGSLYKSAIEANGDEIVISVGKGEVLIKLGQFDTFKF